LSVGDATGAVVLAASVSYSTPTKGAPAGSVEFDDLTTNQVLGTAKLDSSGLASLVVDSGQSIANDTIRAAFQGGDGAAASHADEAVQQTPSTPANPTPSTPNKPSAPVALVTIPKPTSPANATTLAFDTPTVGVNAGPITLHARVSYTNRTSGVPTGTVRFDDLTTQNVLGITATSPSGDATFVLAPGLTAANHTIQATFFGGTNADSSQVEKTVILETPPPAPAATTTTFTAPTSAQLGASIVLTANVSYTTPGNGEPSGSVEFDDVTTGKTLGTVGLNSSGVATLQIPTGLPVAGSQTIRAIFQGSSAAAQSQADSAIQVINSATSVTLSAPASVSASTPVTVTATVNSPAGTVNGGSVSFFDGGQSIGSAPVSASGSAALTLPSLAVGSHSLTASFSPAQGSAFHAATTSSPAVIQVVAPSTTPITPSSPSTPTSPTTPTTPTTSTVPIASVTTLTASLLRPGPHAGRRMQVVFLAHVSSTAASPSVGQVAFLVAGQRVSVATLDANGNASFAVSPSTALHKPVMAQFLGGTAGPYSLLASQSQTLATTRRSLMGRG
jgi:hypothetical protein